MGQRLKNTILLQNITGANRATLIKMYLQKDSLGQVSISIILASGEVYSTVWNTTAFFSKPNHPTTQLLQQTDSNIFFLYLNYLAWL